jgi:pantoate--beta-alanine ligase
MHECREVAELRTWREARRAEGKTVALVPTMGFLHEGHLALVDEARRRADAVVMSSFVNPLQFGPGEDLDAYPRDEARDGELARSRGVDLLFLPAVETMYPPGAETHVVPGDAGVDWEGRFRPGHFDGVLTVVATLFHLVAPEVACFGQKDIQQATLIRRMVRDLQWDLEVVVVPTVREADGLAMSSRNVYLTPEERVEAAGLSGALAEAHRAWNDGERNASAIVDRMQDVLGGLTALELQYIAVVEPDGFRPVSTVTPETIVAVAARVGRARLIDNITLSRGLQ